MDNFLEKYPACATCPRIIEWQESRDKMMAQFEAATIADSLRQVAREHERAEMDEKYADFLDQAEEAEVPGVVVIEAQEAYDTYDSTTEEAERVKTKKQTTAFKALGFITMIEDHEVGMITLDCRGPLALSLLGLHKTICRSHLPRSLSIRPPAPFPHA